MLGRSFLDRVLPRSVELNRELRRQGRAFDGLFGTPDGRWTMVSTSVAASMAVAVTWLAMAAAPPDSTRTYEPRPADAALPYDLLARLPGSPSLPALAGENYRGAGFMMPGSTGLLRTVQREAEGLISPVDAKLAEERSTVGVPGVETRTLAVAHGGTLIGMLQDAGVTPQDAIALVEVIRPVYSPRSIRAGQVFEANFGLPQSILPQRLVEAAPPDTQTESLLSLTFSPSVERQITVQLTAPGEYSVHDVQRELESRFQHAGATIDSSLYLAAMQTGIPASVVIEMIHMFSYDVDFQRDVHPGDKFEVFFNSYYTPEGETAKSGDILTATMTLSGKAKTLYRYEAEEDDEYFDSDGNSARSMLMKTPVDGARISSGFGARRHPILGYTRMHKGMDFAVPNGTPVMAAGNGTVTFAGKNSGYGNLLVITHSNGYSTAYAHLSRFASGIKKGARVRQGTIVAHSGQTGLATGPHLHYEIRVNKTPVNPTQVKVATGRKLEGRELTAFRAKRVEIDQLVASLPMQSQVAEATLLRDISEQ